MSSIRSPEDAAGACARRLDLRTFPKRQHPAFPLTVSASLYRPLRRAMRESPFKMSIGAVLCE